MSKADGIDEILRKYGMNYAYGFDKSKGGITAEEAKQALGTRMLELVGEDEERHELNPSMNQGILQMVREENYLADNRNKLRAELRTAIHKEFGLT